MGSLRRFGLQESGQYFQKRLLVSIGYSILLIYAPPKVRQGDRLPLCVVQGRMLQNGVHEFNLQNQLRVELQRQCIDFVREVRDRSPAPSYFIRSKFCLILST
jgi:hypothetical protein